MRCASPGCTLHSRLSLVCLAVQGTKCGAQQVKDLVSLSLVTAPVHYWQIWVRDMKFSCTFCHSAQVAPPTIHFYCNLVGAHLPRQTLGRQPVQPYHNLKLACFDLYTSQNPEWPRHLLGSLLSSSVLKSQASLHLGLQWRTATGEMSPQIKPGDASLDFLVRQGRVRLGQKERLVRHAPLAMPKAPC